MSRRSTRTNVSTWLARFAAGSAALYALQGLVRHWSAEKPQIFAHEDDERMKVLLQKTKSLNETFKPTFWAHGKYGQLGLLLLWKIAHNERNSYYRQILKCDDGGEVAVDEFIDRQNKLADDAPILLILHTITGNAMEENELAKMSYARGFRPIVLCRRGHLGKKLSTAKFNLLGCTADTELMVQHVREKYPNSFIGAVGISAGSGQVVSYIGKQGESLNVQAAVSLCPAYDISTAFGNFELRNPFLAKFLLNGLKRYFLWRNQHLLRDLEGFEECLSTFSIQKFVELASPMAGFADFEQYLADSNPMTHYANNKVPCLILNSLDDPLCVKENIPFHIVSQTTNYSLVLTPFGSHVAFRDGVFGHGSYMYRVAVDFIEQAMLQVMEEKNISM